MVFSGGPSIQKESVDEFFSQLLFYVKPNDDLSVIMSNRERASAILKIIEQLKLLLVLDGFEKQLQQDSGSTEYRGIIRNADLYGFLKDFNLMEHGSFCIITTRISITDLETQPSTNYHRIQGIQPNDGAAFLSLLGVKGTYNQRIELSEHLNGHVSILKFVGNYIAECRDGDPKSIQGLLASQHKENHIVTLQYFLDDYHRQFTSFQRSLLLLISRFRESVPIVAIDKVSKTLTTSSSITFPILQAETSERRDSILNLIRIGAIQQVGNDYPITDNLSNWSLDLHVKIGNLFGEFYNQTFNEFPRAARNEVHKAICLYYLQSADPDVMSPTLADFSPFIEAVHHACRAEEYREAMVIMWEHIYRKEQFSIGGELGAVDTELSMLEDFFPDKDYRKYTYLGMGKEATLILNAYGYSLSNSGRLDEARAFFEFIFPLLQSNQSDPSLVLVYRNLCELSVFIGNLFEGAEYAKEYISLTDHLSESIPKDTALEGEYAQTIHHQVESRSWAAWIAYLHGDIETAQTHFKDASNLSSDLPKKYLYPPFRSGIGYADLLLHMNHIDLAEKVALHTLETMQNNSINKKSGIALCHRLLGDIASQRGQIEGASQLYEKAYKMSQQVERREVEIEVLIAYASHLIRYAEETKDLDKAEFFLERARMRAENNNYRVFEAKANVQLGLLCVKQLKPEKAIGWGEKARELSENIGYHWGDSGSPASN